MSSEIGLTLLEPVILFFETLIRFFGSRVQWDMENY